MTYKFKLNHILHGVGGALAIISLFFVTYKLKSYWGDGVKAFLTYDHLVNIAFISSIYGVGSIILGCVWRCILTYLGEVRSYWWAISIYGTSQLAKYVPGNIMHLAGRQAISMANGANGKKIAKSIAVEFFILGSVGAILSFLAVPKFLNMTLEWYSIPLYLLLVFFCVSFVFIAAPKLLFNAFVLQGAFTILTGLTFLITLNLVDTTISLSIENSLFVIACYIAAWAIGLVTPGAPAGLGIREFIIVFLLGDVSTESNLLLAVVLSRIITVSGDVIFFCIAMILRFYEGRVLKNDI